MRYQFMIPRPPDYAVFAALVSLGVAGYAFAACGDRTPNRASAEPVITTPAPIPAPSSRPASEPAAPTTASGFYSVGRTAWKAGDFARAESAFVQALALDSTHVRSRVYLARILIESGRAGDALQHIEAAVALDSTSSEPLRLLGRAYEVLGRSDEAIDA
jgi:tetratricopeptide (TPR) repeat protein